MTEGRRTAGARIGIAALNLLYPGLGVLKAGKARAAGLLMGGVVAVYLLLVAFYALAPELSFTGYLVSSLTFLAAVLCLIGVSMALSWRHGRVHEEEPAWWSRWFTILALAVAAWLLLLPLLLSMAHGFYKPFYLPSDGMAPTLLRNDRLVASMRAPAQLKRGDLILLDVGESIYIKRIAALPGDRIAMEAGIVRLNGATVPQHFVREDQVLNVGSSQSARRLREQFPGEASPHEIYDLGPYTLDDMPERTIPPGHVFVLGDNRDRSADSRVARIEMGVELLPIADIQGKALFYTWGPSGKTGEPLNR